MMLRGIRWQIIAFVLALIVFSAAVVTRIANRTMQDNEPPVTQTAAEVTVAATDQPAAETSTPETEQAAAPTTQAISNTSITQVDGVTTYTEAVIGRVQRLNPLFADLNSVDRDITSLIFEGLFEINEFGEPTPLLAEDYLVSNDGLEYAIRLRDDVLWQDGQPFTARDVAYTISLLQDPDFPGSDALKRFWSTVEVEVLNDFTVRFRLTQPLAAFPTNLTIGLLPEHALRGTTAADIASHPFNFSPIGTGPYQLEAIRSDSGGIITAVDLRVAPVYRQRPEVESGSYAMERISFRIFDTFDAATNALAAGEVMGLASRQFEDRPALLDIPGMDVYTTVAPAVGVLIYNWDETEQNVRFFSDQRIRRALQLGVSIAGPVESHLANRAIPADSVLLPTHSWAYLGQGQPAIDVTQARDILENTNLRPVTLPEEGETDAESVEGEAITIEDLKSFSLLVPQQPAIEQIAQEVVAQWSQIGLTVTIEAVPQDEFEQRLRDGDFDTAIVELAMGADPDVYAYWHAGQYPDGLNYGAMIDDRLSEALERARRETNGVNRAALYHEFQRQFRERAAAIPMYYPLFTYTVNSQVNGVQLGFISKPSDRFRTIERWTYE